MVAPRFTTAAARATARARARALAAARALAHAHALAVLVLVLLLVLLLPLLRIAAREGRKKGYSQDRNVGIRLFKESTSTRHESRAMVMQREEKKATRLCGGDRTRQPLEQWGRHFIERPNSNVTLSVAFFSSFAGYHFDHAMSIPRRCGNSVCERSAAMRCTVISKRNRNVCQNSSISSTLRFACGQNSSISSTLRFACGKIIVILHANSRS